MDKKQKEIRKAMRASAEEFVRRASEAMYEEAMKAAQHLVRKDAVDWFNYDNYDDQSRYCFSEWCRATGSEWSPATSTADHTPLSENPARAEFWRHVDEAVEWAMKQDQFKPYWWQIGPAA
jgi:hypothetical protein